MEGLRIAKKLKKNKFEGAREKLKSKKCLSAQ